jgi:histidinol-phosphatase (PHP family)
MIIQKEIALEANTYGIASAFNEWMPNPSLINLYRDMGGRLLAIGSDAHVPQNVGNAFLETKKMLSDLGFDSYCYYEKRQKQNRRENTRGFFKRLLQNCGKYDKIIR